MSLPTSPEAVARRRDAIERLAAITVVLAVFLVIAVAASGQLVLIVLTSAALFSAWLLLRRLQQ